MSISPSVAAVLVAVLATGGTCSRAPAQSAPDSVARFLERAREATQRYQDRAVAIEAGYRRIGPDFPGMGEHWISVRLAFRSDFDAARPAVLEYVDVGGQPRLVGVAYVLPLLAGESAPTFPTPHSWHDHTESVEEESAALAQVTSMHSTSDGARLAMMHAWIWLDNPESPFASDNWTLPFIRLGIAPPRGLIPPDAARALSLPTGGGAYYTSVYQRLASPGKDSALIAAALDSARRAVDALLATRPEQNLGAHELDELAAIWRGMWDRLERELPASAYRPLSKLRHR